MIPIGYKIKSTMQSLNFGTPFACFYHQNI